MNQRNEEKKARTVKVLAVTQRQAVLNAMPGTANQIAERTGTNVNAVWHHIYSLRDSGEVENAGRIRTPTPAARFRTAVVYGKTGELPELPPLGPVERAKDKPRPHRKKKPTKPPHTAKKAWVIDSPYRTIFAGPHPYGGSERRKQDGRPGRPSANTSRPSWRPGSRSQKPKGRAPQEARLRSSE